MSGPAAGLLHLALFFAVFALPVTDRPLAAPLALVLTALALPGGGLEKQQRR